MTDAILARFASDEPEGPPDVYDFQTLGLAEKDAVALRDGFVGITWNYRRTSRRQAWRSVMKFANFLKETPATHMHSGDVLVRFAEWLKGHLLEKTCQGQYNLVAAIYRWLADNDAKNTIRWNNVNAPKGLFTKEEVRARNISLSERELREILRATKQGIDAVRRRFTSIAEALEGRFPSDVQDADRRIITRIIDATRAGVIGKRRQELGRYIPVNTSWRELAGYVFPKPGDFVPYAIYMMLETHANPSGVFNLQVDCLTDHPVDPLKKRLAWDKFRATQEQSSDVGTEGAYAIPKLIDEVRSATELIRPFAGHHRTRLFITPWQGAASIVSVQAWHNELDAFIKKCGLSDFNFVDLRASTIAVLAARGEGYDQLQRRLQHRNAETTNLYIRVPERRAQASKKLMEFMGQIVRAAQTGSHKMSAFGTAHGYDCNDPLAGVAPESRPGAECTNYLHCAFCPNSIAVLDSPKHVARMISASRLLDKMEEDGRISLDVAARYKAAYQDAHGVLKQLLARVPSKVLRESKLLADSQPVLPQE